MAKEKISGAEALIRALIAEHTEYIFGYPGGAIMPVFDVLYDYRDRVNHILVRHEQGATHAAQGYARVSGKTGVVLVTSGPAATNIITGLSDAMMDSTPLIVITGQVGSSLLGSDAFQETDVVGITQPVTKWSYQIRHSEEIAWAVARAFYIAGNGRPGPVVLDIAKDAQTGLTEFDYQPCQFIRSYNPNPAINMNEIDEAARLINQARKPFILAGQGVIIAQAEAELAELAEKADIPVGCTLLGLSAIPTDHPLYKGMLGMHGSVAANIKTNECDLLIAIGMRFDDRVTGDVNQYARQARIIHIDIDPSEINKNIRCDVSVLGDARAVLQALNPRVEPARHTEWLESFAPCEEVEQAKVIEPEIHPQKPLMNMGEVARKVSEATGNDSILVTDVGQNQMLSARYYRFKRPRSLVTSGGLGTMGFGLPAAIGAKIGAPDRTVCFFTGDGGIQMTIQELGTIMQYGVDVKIIILNNNFLGMVRQWQALFFDHRYSETPMLNPDFTEIAAAYGIDGERVATREELDGAIDRMLSHKGSYLLDVQIDPDGMVFPMTPAGACVTHIMLNATEKYE
ncbi:MAG TPA: biosynthetic-type acetolactate synthase large subunit [Candidatus Barnesiella merdipullorum]|nr:biosynthetic-type acetolactate synthase large subunit [Candidatus Barnesiella merdipullorum]